MYKIDKTVIKETKYIAFFVLILSFVMQLIFFVLGKWNYTVLLGNLLSGFVAVANFLLMGITVQNAVLKDEKDAKKTIRVSQIYRNLGVLIFTILGVVLPCFNTVCVFVPVFFPRIAVAFRPLFKKF